MIITPTDSCDTNYQTLFIHCSVVNLYGRLVGDVF